MPAFVVSDSAPSPILPATSGNRRVETEGFAVLFKSLQERTHASGAAQRVKSPSLPARLAISWLTNALVLAVVAAVLSRVDVKNAGSLLAAAAVFGVLNTVLKPVIRLVTLPLAILTLGVAWFFVSMLMLILTRALVGGFHIHGFWTLVAATLIIWVVNLGLDLSPGPWQLTGHRQKLAGRPRRRRK
jgi:putative membrane protein